MLGCVLLIGDRHYSRTLKLQTLQLFSGDNLLNLWYLIADQVLQHKTRERIDWYLYSAQIRRFKVQRKAAISELVIHRNHQHPLIARGTCHKASVQQFGF